MITKIILHPNTSLLFRLIVGSVFIYAGVVKAADPFGFSIQIRNYHLLPVSVTNLVAIFLPWLEIFCGLMLITGYYLKMSSRFLIAILTIFIVAISSALVRDFDISCGCYSTSQDSASIGFNHIAEDAIMLVMTIQILLVQHHPVSIENWLRLKRN